MLKNIDYVAISAGFAGVCGSLSYLLKVEEGKPFKWKEFFLHTAISAMFGAICFEIAAYEGLPPAMSGALSGMAGWMGTRVARIFEIILARKLKIEDLERKDKHE